MFKKLVKLLFKSGKKATTTTSKSMDFIDEVLEKEYITNAVDNLKTSSGKIVEKAGMVYQQTKDAFDENMDVEKLKGMGDKIVEKGKEITEDLSESMQESSATHKSVMDEGEKIVKKVLGDTDNEEE